jgi:hypothetical protein
VFAVAEKVKSNVLNFYFSTRVSSRSDHDAATGSFSISDQPYQSRSYDLDSLTRSLGILRKLTIFTGEGLIFFIVCIVFACPKRHRNEVFSLAGHDG